MKTHKLTAQIRKETGKNACSRLRRSGFIPAIIYTHGKSEAVQVPRHEFIKLFKGNISESVVIDLEVAGGSAEPEQKVIVKDYQLNPVTDEVTHLDFYKVDLSEKLQTVVPVTTIGTSKGERMGGMLDVIERELQIEALPGDLPEKIEIDVTNLDLGHSIQVKDLPVSGSLRFLADANRVVVTVLIPKAVKEEVSEEAPVDAEAAADGKEKSEE
ncbi:MAG TPA: 50S ribosomal protein L25 [Spirochaetota bacterium]|nr:50S ribosomal protein L25 [Spirochaetota bacterium]